MTIPKDKLYHFAAGAIIAIIGGVITGPITGLGFAIGAGIIKECYDSYNMDNAFDWQDMITTWIGGTVGFVVVSLINYWRT